MPGEYMAVEDTFAGERNGQAAGAVYLTDINRTTIAIAQMAADGCLVSFSSLLSLSFAAFARRHDHIDLYLYIPPTVMATVVLIFILVRSGAYDPFNPFSRFVILQSTIRSIFGVMLLITGCFFVLKVSDDFSRLWLVTWAITSAIGLSGSRLLSATALKTLTQSGRLTKNIAVVGASEAGQRLATKLVQEGPGTRLIGLFDQRHPSRIVTARISDAAVHSLST